MRFIRKGGRVIPIKDKENESKRNLAKGSAVGAIGALAYSEYQGFKAAKEASTTLILRNQAGDLAI